MIKRDFCVVLVSLFIFVNLFGISNAIYGSHEDPSTYRPLQTADDCFPQLNHEPRCAFAISNNASQDLKVECISKERPHPGLRIQGEFHILRLTCTASYAIDFIYYGIQPTEAMFVDWSKEIHPNWDLTDQNYTVEVKVYSVQALFDFYNNPVNSYYERPNEGLPHKTIHDYSRSGNYSFPGVFNKTLGTSFYLFLEDTAKPSFLRNSRTRNVKLTEANDKMTIPCLPSHFNTNVTLDGPSEVLRTIPWNPIHGFEINTREISIELMYGTYTCNLFSGNSQIDTLWIDFQQGKKESNFGLEDFDETGGRDLDITGELNRGGTPYIEYINPVCKTRDPDDKVDPERVQLISVPSHNFGRMRLVQHFALPKFVNRSYTAKITTGAENFDPLLRQIRQPNGVNQRMGTVFCTTGFAQRISDFGSSVRGQFIPFNFGLDWALFNRKSSGIEVHFGIETVNHTGAFYIDSEVTFVCRVNVPVLVKPVVWYISMNNGSIIQTAIDYNLTEDMSTQLIKISNDTKEVICASSYWYSDFWRNISKILNPQEGVKPEIFQIENKYKLTPGSENRNIRCTATGNPPPDIYFEKNGKRVEGVTKTFNSAILLFPKVENSHAGTYTCVAKNVYETRKNFQVVLENDHQDLALVITIPLIVFFLTAFGALIYVKYFRKEKTGLTKQEVEDFLKGLKPEDAKMTAESNDYTHEFAIQRPYVKEYEVSTDRFRIDESKVLGKGAFGLVLEGTVDDIPVAVKTVQRNADKQYLKALLSELKIMIHLGHHDNLISIVGAHTKDLRRGFVYVFVKYIPLGNMQNYLRTHAHYYNYTLTTVLCSAKNKNTFGPYQMMLWARQVASGMEYLGQRNVIHGDLAARNLLLDETKTIKITDFGLSRQLYDYNDYVKKNQEPLPWRWMSIESLKYMSFSKQSDVWSYGVTIWEIFSLGEVPFPGYSWNLEFVEKLEQGLRMGKPKHGPFEMFELLCECWNPDPAKRPSFTHLIKRINGLLPAEANEPNQAVTVDSKELDRVSVANEFTAYGNLYGNTPL